MWFWWMGSRCCRPRQDSSSSRPESRAFQALKLERLPWRFVPPWGASRSKLLGEIEAEAAAQIAFCRTAAFASPTSTPTSTRTCFRRCFGRCCGRRGRLAFARCAIPSNRQWSLRATPGAPWVRRNGGERCCGGLSPPFGASWPRRAFVTTGGAVGVLATGYAGFGNCQLPCFPRCRTGRSSWFRIPDTTTPIWPGAHTAAGLARTERKALEMRSNSFPPLN
jgi:hypothetical protein